MVGTKWQNRSNMSIGLVSVPFLSIITYSKTFGIGLNGARIIKIAITIRIDYGILSMINHMIILRNFLEVKNTAYFSDKRLFVKEINSYM